MRRCLFFQVYECHLSVLKKCRADLTIIAKRLQWDNKIINPLLLSASELIANSAKYSAHPSATQFSIGLFKTLSHIVFEYRDNGAAFNPIHTMPVSLDDIDLLAENGRGLSLLQASFEKIVYHEQSPPFINTVIGHLACPHISSKKQVLLLEDNPAQNFLYKEYLSNDYSVIACHSAQEAIDAIKRQTIDIVVSDISMPGINGIDFRKELLSHSTTDLIPFMFLTGTEDVMNIERLAHLGIDDFLQKPVAKKQLIACIERVLQRTHQLTHRVTQRLDQQITRALRPNLPQHCLSWALAYGGRDTGHGGGDAAFLESTPNPTLVLLDIMGHDISAKFFAHAYTGYLRGLVRSLTPCTQNQPIFSCADVLNHLSDMSYADDLLSQTILTTLIVELLPSGSFHLASAGHPPPIIVRNNGIERLDSGGMLPGLVAQNQYKSQHLTLKKGERLVLYSDGLFEGAEHADDRIQLEQAMLSAISQSISHPIQQANAFVLEAFDRIAGKASDDVTLIMLENRE